MNSVNYEVPDCGAFSIPHSYPSWAQIFASGEYVMVVVLHRSSSEALCDVSEQNAFLLCGFVSLTPNPQAGDHSWSVVYDCLFNISAANLHNLRPTPPSATQGMRHAVVAGTHGWQYSTKSG